MSGPAKPRKPHQASSDTGALAAAVPGASLHADFVTEEQEAELLARVKGE